MSRFYYLIISVILAQVFSSCSEKLVVSQFVDKTDTVYVTDSKIYRDTLHVSDSILLNAKKYDNPVILKEAPDPSLIRKNNIFYLYSTESGSFPNIPIYKSIDLINWYYVGSVFNDKSRPRSFEGSLWAPDINYIEGKSILYYSMSKWGGEWDCGIGVAVADHPKGPFIDIGKLFSSREINVRNSIDPFYITDNGKNYLFWGSHHGIYGIQLSEDGLSIMEGAKVKQIAGSGGEGTCIYKRGQYYYLFLSYGSCCNGLSSTYHICVGRSLDLFGPYVDRKGKSLMEGGGTMLLKGNDFVVGPGHNAEIITDDNGEDWLLYHGYLHSNPELNRLVFLDRIIWKEDWPVMPENAPTKSSVIPFFESSDD